MLTGVVLVRAMSPPDRRRGHAQLHVVLGGILIRKVEGFGALSRPGPGVRVGAVALLGRRRLRCPELPPPGVLRMRGPMTATTAASADRVGIVAVVVARGVLAAAGQTEPREIPRHEGA